MNREVVQPASIPDPRPRYSQGIETTGGRLLFIAGQVAVDASGALVGKGDIAAQTERVFQNLGAVLAEAGGSFEHLVMTTTYVTDIAFRTALQDVRTKYLDRAAPPTSTLLVVKSLANEDYLIEISAIAVIP
jgi:enamine deaminase RidA (YjgF/YER057c/UK114 family)